MVDRQAVFLFASLIYRDISRYVSAHQEEYNEWLASQDHQSHTPPEKGGDEEE